LAIGAVAVPFSYDLCCIVRLGPLAPFITFFPGRHFRGVFGGLGQACCHLPSARVADYFFFAPSLVRIDNSADSANLVRSLLDRSCYAADGRAVQSAAARRGTAALPQ